MKEPADIVFGAVKSLQSGKGSQIARLRAARLAAVQAVYQMKTASQSAGQIVKEYVDHRLGRQLDGQAMVSPDAVLFSNIVSGVETRRADLEGVIDAALALQNRAKLNQSADSIEPLLGSILMCGAYELLAHHEYDVPLLISDYLEVTHAFYEGGESKLVNAVLDRVAKSLRD